MIISGKKEKVVEMQIGDSIVKQETSAKLLGIMIDGKLIEIGSSNQSLNSFIGDATRHWNKAPDIIKESISLYSAKVEVNIFVSTLPI